MEYKGMLTVTETVDSYLCPPRPETYHKIKAFETVSDKSTQNWLAPR